MQCLLYSEKDMYQLCMVAGGQACMCINFDYFHTQLINYDQEIFHI